jgi:putative transposase
VKENNIKISMDGKGRALDNHRIERFLEVTNGRSYTWKIVKLGIS